MLPLLNKTIVQINADVQQGKSVVVTVTVPQSEACTTPPGGVDVVTTATMANYLHNLPHPVPLPVHPKKD